MIPTRAREVADSVQQSQSMREVMKGIQSFNEFVEQAPHRVNVMCFCGGAAIVVNGILGILNVFSAFSDTIYYVVNCYTVFFGLVTCVTESHPSFMTPIHDHLQSIQEWMHEWAKGLTMLWGRGLFYTFQGTLAVLSSGLVSFGIIIGAYMMAMGAVCINLHFRKRAPPSVNVSADHYIRITA
ncbi:unnamed protein product [Polarella glacialis]|uniref:Uncharacterized protein n=1 Tax=Polarella glacialis TaxID=89957 RepID=A0A813KSV7_POLGL|nr:unnamed protein product [Polarella glacialis]